MNSDFFTFDAMPVMKEGSRDYATLPNCLILGHRVSTSVKASPEVSGSISNLCLRRPVRTEQQRYSL